MLTATSKRQILKDAGYAYSFDRLSYVNRKTRKAFSLEFVHDHTESQLKACIDEPKSSQEWKFYFNAPPSEAVKRELSAVFS